MAEQTNFEVLNRVSAMKSQLDEHLREADIIVRERKDFERRSDESRRELGDKLKDAITRIEKVSNEQAEFHADLHTIKNILGFIAAFTGTTTSALVILIIKKWAHL